MGLSYLLSTHQYRAYNYSIPLTSDQMYTSYGHLRWSFPSMFPCGITYLVIGLLPSYRVRYWGTKVSLLSLLLWFWELKCDNIGVQRLKDISTAVHMPMVLNDNATCTTVNFKYCSCAFTLFVLIDIKKALLCQKCH